MTYKNTLDWMMNQLPLYQRQGKSAFKKNLTNIRAFSEKLDHPENKFKSVHVAGTNGKGSVCHMLASIFQEAGYNTGLYTSPHLKDFRERIRLNGKKIPEAAVIDFIDQNQTFLEKQGLSFFEMTVGMAFSYFAQKGIDIALIETGLGGRLDSTNILSPEISVITNIGYDHQNMLGNTLPEIAGEKAGIIKSGIPAVIGESQDATRSVFQQKAKCTSSELFFSEDDEFPYYETDLKGNYQEKNVQTVLKTVEILKQYNWDLNENAVKAGLQNVRGNTGLEGRWQELQGPPKIICDTAHNEQALVPVLDQLQNEDFSRLHIVLGVVNDKKLDVLLPLFPKTATYYFCKPNVPRGLDDKKLRATALDYGLDGDTYQSVNTAYNRAKTRAGEEDLIFIGGSTFTVAEVL